VSPVKYELGFYIPEDDILQINHKFITACDFVVVILDDVAVLVFPAAFSCSFHVQRLDVSLKQWPQIAVHLTLSANFQPYFPLVLTVLLCLFILVLNALCAKGTTRCQATKMRSCPGVAMLEK
jgi:hypothetical protein